MKTSEKNLDDIIFENRNKEYGAYSLRKSYNKNMMSAVIIAIVIFLVGVTVPLLANYFNKGTIIAGGDDIIVIMDNIPKNKEVVKLPETAAETKKVPAYKAPVVVNTDEDTPDDLSELAEKVNNTIPSDTSGGAVNIPDDKPKPTVIDDDINTPAPMIVEEMPEFPGGEAARKKFLSENIKYPQIAREIGTQGPVYVNFVVEKNGSITGVKILRGIGSGCDEEALRVINAMPNWIPGRQNGKEVRVQINMPIHFKLM
ncbi:MAG TPA: TonB family protein [Bacteroidales bacterium]|nr:TonB family protein [Bacteroidales bacterium]